MIEYKVFKAAKDAAAWSFDTGTPSVKSVSDNRIVLEATITSGEMKGETLKLVYRGEFEIDDGELEGEIEEIEGSVDGKDLFRLEFDDELDVEELLYLQQSDDDDDDDDDDDEDEEEDDDDWDDEEYDDEDEDDFDDLADLDALLELVVARGLKMKGRDRDDDLFGESGDDILRGRDGNDHLRGDEGDDVMSGGDGKDKMRGGDGDDVMSGGRGRDDMRGGDDDDDMSGGRGRDKLHGGKGDDIMDGGAGRDVMKGGAGADTFVFDGLEDMGLGSKRDHVKKFATGRDVIDLSGVDADPGENGDQSFEFIGSGPFSEVAGELRFSKGVLRGDVDGDGSSDFHIRIGGVSEFDIDDFLL